MIEQKEKLKAAFAGLIAVCPMPYTLDQDNFRGVCVKDARGNIVYLETYDWPDEFTSNQIESEVARTRALAHYLIAMSDVYEATHPLE